MSDYAMNVTGTASANRNSLIYACTKKSQISVLRKAKGKAVVCTSGLVWVTVENDTADYLLGPNESLTIPNGGKALVSGKGCYLVA